jgi:hypothetical protein
MSPDDAILRSKYALAYYNHNKINIVTWRPKAGIAEPEWKSIASQWLAEHTFPQ